jgi:ElaB/YqjD/DUF883 family membrane-anchored ribosome-binding protein
MNMEDKLLNEIVQRLVAIETKLEDIIKVKDDVDELKKEVVKLEENNKQQQKEIDSLVDNNKWLSRAVAGAVVTAIIGVVFVFIKMGLGINP